MFHSKVNGKDVVLIVDAGASRTGIAETCAERYGFDGREEERGGRQPRSSKKIKAALSKFNTGLTCTCSGLSLNATSL